MAEIATAPRWWRTTFVSWRRRVRAKVKAKEDTAVEAGSATAPRRMEPNNAPPGGPASAPEPMPYSDDEEIPF